MVSQYSLSVPPNCSTNFMLLSWSLKVQEVYLDDKGKKPTHQKKYLVGGSKSLQIPQRKGKERDNVLIYMTSQLGILSPSFQSIPESAGYEN